MPTTDKTDPATHDARLSSCTACPHCDPATHRCTSDGKDVNLKARLSAATCPENLWPG